MALHVGFDSGLSRGRRQGTSRTATGQPGTGPTLVGLPTLECAEARRAEKRADLRSGCTQASSRVSVEGRADPTVLPGVASHGRRDPLPACAMEEEEGRLSRVLEPGDHTSRTACPREGAAQAGEPLEVVEDLAGGTSANGEPREDLRARPGSAPEQKRAEARRTTTPGRSPRAGPTGPSSSQRSPDPAPRASARSRA
jgi:hypothetical protein